MERDLTTTGRMIIVGIVVLILLIAIFAILPTQFGFGN